ncbi:DNA-processing protein DprA [Geminocystis sp. NIES-3709]|uniref:DNA-processing protein DprA n=1 Tax=Geminocystis sp. NIES-3709 TaxID=1617448 RepID=UPI0005FCBB68|nr:DNA-processing protein DprA [Geminocystis sp. NIES-3709]BAQ65328.1 rossmann fold nucleotide-binding protein Smf [Geminocystis sp. NIES-3709]
MIQDTEKIYWLAWSKIKGVGVVSLKKIYDYFGNLEQAWTASSQELMLIDGIGKKLCNLIQEEKRKIEPEKLYLKHIEKNPKFWTVIELEYPKLLLEIPSPPSILYYLGQVNLSENQGITPLIGIVGTRKPTEHGKKWTYNISKALGKNGFTVVSGLAEGIDTVAHRGCLDGGGRTIAVLGNGLDRAYPSNNRQLMAEIAEKGLIMTEYEYGSQPERGNFPARNRIVAGLCRAVLVMEAPEKSGALITARYANEFNRDVYTLPNSPDNVQARGCLRLIHNGAEIIINEEELLSSLGIIPSLDQGQQLSLFPVSSPSLPEKTPKEPRLSSSFKLVYDSIEVNPTLFDVIVDKSQLNSGEVSGILLQLELDGLITQLPGMMYCRA